MESNQGFACKILNYAKFAQQERLPEGDVCIALFLGFSGSPTGLTTLLKAVLFVSLIKIAPILLEAPRLTTLLKVVLFLVKQALELLSEKGILAYARKGRY